MKDEKNKADLKIAMGKRLKRIRYEHEYSQDNMAEILEISPAYYGKVERGVHSLSIEKLLLLNTKLNVDMNFLILGKKLHSSTMNEIIDLCPEAYKNDLLIIISHLLNLVSGGENND